MRDLFGWFSSGLPKVGPELSTEEMDHVGMGLGVRLNNETEDERDERVARELAKRRAA